MSWEWLSDAGSGVSDWLSKGDNLKTVASIGGAVADYKSSKDEAKISKQILDMQKENYNLYKQDRARELAKENETQANIDNAFASVFPTKKKDDVSMELV